jgi:hypothetical protein
LAGLKAQTSVEFLILLAISIAIITMIVLLAREQIGTVQTQKESSDLRNALLDISAAAKEVYAQGEGSKKKVYVILPSCYAANESYVSNKSIRIRARGTDYVSVENFDVHGTLPGTAGGHWIWVISEGHRVRIGLAMIELSSNSIYVLMNRNSSMGAPFSVENVWVRGISVTASTVWTASEVLASGVPFGFSLDPAESETIPLQFTAGENASGFYTGRIVLSVSDGAGSTETVDIPLTVQVIGDPSLGPRPGEDFLGPIIINMYQIPTPAKKFEPLAIYVDASDEGTGNSTIKSCIIDADNANTWQAMTAVDGAYDEPLESSVFNYSSGFNLGPHTIRARCTDNANNTGPMGYYYFNVSEVDQLGPLVMFMNHTEGPTTMSDVYVGGIVTDAYTGNSKIKYCLVKIDSGPWHNTTADDGAFDSPTENYTYHVGTVGVGYHRVYHQCTDIANNTGPMYNDSFGVVDVDFMLVFDKSGSMAWNVTNAVNSTIVTTTNTGFTKVKTMDVTSKNGDVANLTTELSTSASGCTVFYEARISGNVVANGSRTATTYAYLAASIDITGYLAPFQIDLYLKRSSSGSCTAYNRGFSVQQLPSKLKAAQTSAKIFIDIVSDATQGGLVSYSTSASTDRTLTPMGTANKTALKSSVDAIAATGSTCIECGLDNAVNELISARGKPTATRVIILLTDGEGNVGDTVAGATYCRNNNVTVYAIGFGSDVNDVELTNVALLTHGEYYFAPDAATLTEIFQNIGK